MATQSFLDTDTEVRSYFIGYWLADGTMNKKTVLISSVDKEIIDKIAQHTGYSNKILVKDNSELGWKDLYTLHYSGKIKQKMIEFGFTPGNKTGEE